MEVAASSQRSRSSQRWESLRQIFLPESLEGEANKARELTPSQRRWEYLRQTLFDDSPVERRSVDVDAVVLSPFATTPTDGARDAGRVPYTSSSADTIGALDTRRMDDAVVPIESGPDTVKPHELTKTQSPEATEELKAPTVAINEEQQVSEPQSTAPQSVESPEWGTPEEVEALNRDIQEGLEILGVPSPARFFVEGVENFPSVVHYYVHLMRKLDEAGIDLMESFCSHLGAEHPLVVQMQSMLANERQRTYLTREPTTFYDARVDAARGIACPGMQEFSDESRALSWVIRTGPRSVKPRGSGSGVERGLPPIAGSVTNESSRYSESVKTGPGVIVCPELPLSIDAPEHPRTINPALAANPPRRSFWTRVTGCFCFSA